MSGEIGLMSDFEAKPIIMLENMHMALMRVRRMAQLTLPAEVRRALNVQEGDFLEATIVSEGVLLGTPIDKVSFQVRSPEAQRAVVNIIVFNRDDRTPLFASTADLIVPQR